MPFAGRSALRAAGGTRPGHLGRRPAASDRDHGVIGPAPVQDPGPPIWAGAMTPAAIARAARVADGFIFGTAGSAAMTERAPGIREAFAVQGKPDIVVAGLAYVGVGDDPRAALDEAAHHVLRYYGQIWTEPENLIHHGPAPKLAEEVAAYEDAIDVLILFPQIPRLDQVEQIAEHVLPAYRAEAVAAR